MKALCFWFAYAFTFAGLTACGGGSQSEAGEPLLKLPYVPTPAVVFSSTPSNAAPVANAGSNQNVVTGSTVTLDGSTSSDANGDPLAYAWTLTSKPAGSAAALAGGTSARPTFTADAAGTYVASLVVNDGKVSSTSAAVVVNASAPAPVSVTLYLFGGSNHDLYIGCLTCNSFHLESVCNQFGSYGSQFASLSIWNQFGLYGSQFATSSPWNQFSSGGPKIIGSDNLFYGYFTTNQFQFSRTTIPAFLNVLNHFSRTADLSATRIFTCGN